MKPKEEFEPEFEGSRTRLSGWPYLVTDKSVEPRTLPDNFDASADEFAYLAGVVEFPSPATVSSQHWSVGRPFDDAGQMRGAAHRQAGPFQ